MIDPSRSVYRTADIFLSELIIDTDQGYTPSIFEQKLMIKNYTYEGEIREQTVSLPFNGENTVAEFYFRKSDKVFIFQRKIGNLLTVLSYLGGIWSSLFIFLFPFIQQYNKYSFLNKLSNKIYNFPNQIKQKKMNMYKKSAFQHLTILENKVDRLTPNPKTNFDFFLNKMKNYFRYDRKLRTNFFDILKIIFYSLIKFLPWNPMPKIELLLKSKNSLLEDLDLYNILRRLHDLEKLKALLFTSEQIKILNFSPKPNIRIPLRKKTNSQFESRKESNNKKLFSDKTNYDNIQVFEELIQIWTNLKNDSNSKLNNDLCKMFGEEFSTMFDLSEEYIEAFLIKKEHAEIEGGSEENFNNCEEK